MGNKNNFIELNGKRYDAVTGVVLADISKSSVTAHRAAKAAPKAHHRMDDIVRSATHPSAPESKKSAPRHLDHHATASPTKAKQPIMDIARGPKQHLPAHQPQHAKTLMRHVVRKPNDTLKRHIKPHIPTDVLVKTPSVMVLPKLSFEHVDSERLRRAKRIAKNRLIRRFAPLQPTTMLSASTGRVSLAPSAFSQSPPVAPKPARPASAHAAVNRSMDIFERALAHANSHEQPAVPPKKHAKADTKRRKGILGRRALSTTAMVAAIVLVSGFIGLQNKANITMRVASAKAGFHATLPGYKPSGFAVGTFQYSPGQVAVNFHSNSDGRAFNITQKTSNWDSETLLDNYVATSASDYQAFQDNGRTVYVYGNNNATWVNNGVWYQVTDNGSLSTNQVLQLAQSM